MKKIVFVNLITTFFLFTGCTKEKKIPVAINETPIFRWAVPQIPKSLDWRDCSADLCRHQSLLLMEGLTRLTVAGGTIRTIPALAERWEYVSPREIEITLRKNVLWDDGTLLTADHFLKAWEGAKTALLEPILNMRAFRSRKVPFRAVGVKAVTKNTLRIVLETPHPNFMAAMADPGTFPWAGRKKGVPIFLGPYRLSETGTEKSVFLRNASYYGPRPTFARVELIKAESPDHAAQMFAEDQIDFVDDLPRAHPQATLFPTSHFYVLSFADHAPMQIPNLRKAFRFAIDAGEFQRVLKREELSTHRLFPFEPRKTTPFSPDRARELFESVFPKNSVRPNVTLAVQDSVGTPAYDLAKNLQAQWLKNLDPIALELKTHTQNPDIVLKEWTWDPRRPFMGLETELTLAFRSHRKVSALSLFATTEEAIIKKLLGLEDALLEEDLSVVPLLRKNRRVLLKGNVRGLTLNPLEVWDLREVTL